MPLSIEATFRASALLAWWPVAMLLPLHAAEMFPVRVHVFEDFETEIEKRWWLRGDEEKGNVPPSLSASVGNQRAFRATSTKNFDRKQVDQSLMWKAVIFNPVPGPPMGSRTRLSFRYRLSGTDTIRVQIYSLSKGYHRFLNLTDLPTGEWQRHTVDMTKARRPDGTGGALAADERIDDIQFYIDPEGDLLIDDIVLYEASRDGEPRKFPARIIFTGWFDTGKQGVEWPGEFEIVPHEEPRTWDAAKSILRAGSNEQQTLRVNMRGERILSHRTALDFDYRLNGPRGPLRIDLTGEDGAVVASRTVDDPERDRWATHTAAFSLDRPASAANIVFTPPPGATLWVDDLLLYEETRDGPATAP